MEDFISQINALEKENTWNEDAVYLFIHRGLSELLARDIQLLFQLLYRMDVKESLVKEAFSHAKQTDNIPHELTLLLIDRLKQKVEIRRRYSSS